MMFLSPAYAAASEPGGFDLISFLPMIVIFILFWVLLVRPQQKQAKARKQMLTALEKGDEVVTQGGLVGRITKLNEQYIVLEIAKNVVIQVQRAAITGKLDPGVMESLS